MKLAILGGSFNPVHNGHLSLANCAVNQLGYDTVAFVPAYNPPHKEIASGASTENRLEMLAMAISTREEFYLEPCEIERKGVSYTIDTVSYLEKKYIGSLEGPIGLIIGDDLVSGFHLWQDVQALVRSTRVLLATRLQPMANTLDFPFNHTVMHNAIVDVSSEGIRNNIKNGKDWEELVPACVYKYIIDRNLYVKDAK